MTNSFTTDLLYFGKSTTIHSILQSVENTTLAVQLGNAHNVSVECFTTKSFAVSK